MSWTALIGLFDMGKHAMHIWASYAFCLLVLAGIVAHAVSKKNKALRKLLEKSR